MLPGPHDTHDAPGGPTGRLHSDETADCGRVSAPARRTSPMTGEEVEPWLGRGSHWIVENRLIIHGTG